jgi:hypothetical protein
MFHQTIVGKPKYCLNRNCKHPFFKESHLGWLPKSEVEVYSIMRCPNCKDTFAVVQLISMAHDYKSNLPSDPSQVHPGGNISKKEILTFRKKLQSKDSLKTLLEGYKPGGSVLPEEDQDI